MQRSEPGLPARLALICGEVPEEARTEDHAHAAAPLVTLAHRGLHHHRDELVRTLGALGILELLLALVLRPVDAAHLLEVVLADEDHHALGVVDAAAPA